MAGLQLDVGGSSTSAANISSGGNAGIQFAPKGVGMNQIMLLSAVGLAAWFLFFRK